MSNGHSLDTDDLREATDIGELLAGDDVREAVDGEQLGRIVGREIGATLGRRLGSAIERWVVGSSATTNDADDEDGEDSQTEATEDEEDDTQEETTGDEDESAIASPESVDELKSLSYRDLQQLAKKHDVKANLSKDDLREELTTKLGLEQDT